MKPRIVITIAGGTIENIYSTADFDFIIADFDLINCGEGEIAKHYEADEICPDGDFTHLIETSDRVGQQAHDELKEIQKELDSKV